MRRRSPRTAAEVEAYFEGLDRETDPILIAQKATMRPAFPALDAVAEPVAEAAADAAEPAPADEPAMVGVMDPESPAEPVESWAAPTEASATPEPVESSDGARDRLNRRRRCPPPVTATHRRPRRPPPIDARQATDELAQAQRGLTAKPDPSAFRMTL